MTDADPQISYFKLWLLLFIAGLGWSWGRRTGHALYRTIGRLLRHWWPR